ncbi:MAG: hypothetical protein V4539_04535 [Bacteroidota bacterium]
MTNIYQPAREETGFTNDQLTEMVLHKDDEPIIQNGEIIDEPDDVDDNAIVAADADVFPLAGDSSTCWFPIHFSYNGTDHTGDVQRIQTQLAEEFHVSSVIPAIDHLPEPFIVAELFSGEKVDYPVNESYYPTELGNTIRKAIRQGAMSNSKK